MSPLMQQLEATAGFIQSKITTKANTAIILGSGLGNLSSVIEADFSIPYNEIPNFPVSTVEGHKGRLILGTLNGKKVWVMEGRFHFYEGYTAEQVVFPIRVLKLLGVENLLLSNAAGGVNKDYEVGDLMIIKDHISFFTPNPLLGKNESALGTRFPDMSEPYANTFIEKAKQIAINKGVSFAATIAQLEDHSFDVITMWHVLEHVPDLDQQIKELKRLLKPSGSLIIAVPNFKSFDAQHYGKFWAAYDVPIHFWHFSKTAIQKLFQKEQMELVKILPMKFDSFYVSLLSEKYKTGRMNFIKAFFIGLWSNIKGKSDLEYSSHIYILKNW